jgi:hypothetical protein
MSDVPKNLSTNERHRADRATEKRHLQQRKHRLKRYNLTLEEYAKLAASQKNLCAICQKPETKPNVKYLSVDHDHITGKVRGLLCYVCNTRIGILENELWRKAAENYLSGS